jgi:hypothetical protein
MVYPEFQGRALSARLAGALSFSGRMSWGCLTAAGAGPPFQDFRNSLVMARAMLVAAIHGFSLGKLDWIKTAGL